VDVNYHGVCRTDSKVEWVKRPEVVKNIKTYTWTKPAEKVNYGTALPWGDYSF
jgi:hypothetical protein